jgi:hypothetical protein
MSEWLLRGDYGVAPTNYATLVVALLLAFVCGHLVAWTYMITHSGLSYSRSYVNTLILMPVIVAMVMLILANNIVLAFGLMAIFAMVRFRSILRDTLDTSYVLAVIVIGLACGTLKLTSAMIGCVAVVALMFYFWFTEFGTRHRYDLILHLQWARSAEELAEVRRCLQRHSRAIQCSSRHLRDGGEGLDISYRLLLCDPARTQELVDDLKAVEGVVRLSCIEASDESEI